MDAELLVDIERIAAEAESVGVGFTALLGLFAATRPDCDVGSLRALDVAGDARRLEEWFRTLVASDPPSPDISTLYFGLVEMRSAGTRDRLWTLYACGFVAGREPGPAPEWWPAGRHADSAVLRAVSELLPFWSDDDRLVAEYALVLGYALLVGRLLANAAAIPDVETFVGFDEGDFFRVR